MLLLIAFLLAGLWAFAAVTALAVCRAAAHADALDRAPEPLYVAAAGPRPRAFLAK